MKFFSFEMLWKFWKFWNFMKILTFFKFFKFLNFLSFLNFLKILKSYDIFESFEIFLKTLKSCEILEIWNFMKFSNILISKKQFLCNKKPYCTLVPRNFIHWFCTRVQYAFLLNRNCFLLINMLVNGISRVLLLANRKTVK